VSMACLPTSVLGPPMSILLGYTRSRTAVPSARNSGLLSTMKSTWLAERMFSIYAAVRMGTVDRSTTILLQPCNPSCAFTIIRTEDSRYLMSAASSAPYPEVFVGVPTAINMISAVLIAFSTSIEKNKFFPLHCSTSAYKPGS